MLATTWATQEFQSSRTRKLGGYLVLGLRPRHTYHHSESLVHCVIDRSLHRVFLLSTFRIQAQSEYVTHRDHWEHSAFPYLTETAEGVPNEFAFYEGEFGVTFQLS